jgi:hypothetical protein
MGKSHRNVAGGSCSVSYQSCHDRGFAKRIKADSHRRIRSHNRNCDDDTIENFNCKIGKMNESIYAKYSGPLGNIPNFPYSYMTDEKLKFDYKYKWENKDKSLIETIGTILNDQKKEYIKHNFPADRYLNASKKQLERRGKLGRFYGHNKNNKYKNDTYRGDENIIDSK